MLLGTLNKRVLVLVLEPKDMKGWRLLGGNSHGMPITDSTNLGKDDAAYGKISSPALEDLRSWQQLVSLWDR